MTLTWTKVNYYEWLILVSSKQMSSFLWLGPYHFKYLFLQNKKNESLQAEAPHTCFPLLFSVVWVHLPHILCRHFTGKWQSNAWLCSQLTQPAQPNVTHGYWNLLCVNYYSEWSITNRYTCPTEEENLQTIPKNQPNPDFREVMPESTPPCSTGIKQELLCYTYLPYLSIKNPITVF